MQNKLPTRCIRPRGRGARMPAGEMSSFIVGKLSPSALRALQDAMEAGAAASTSMGTAAALIMVTHDPILSPHIWTDLAAGGFVLETWDFGQLVWVMRSGPSGFATAAAGDPGDLPPIEVLPTLRRDEDGAPISDGHGGLQTRGGRDAPPDSTRRDVMTVVGIASTGIRVANSYIDGEHQLQTQEHSLDLSNAMRRQEAAERLSGSQANGLLSLLRAKIAVAHSDEELVGLRARVTEMEEVQRQVAAREAAAAATAAAANAAKAKEHEHTRNNYIAVGLVGLATALGVAWIWREEEKA